MTLHTGQNCSIQSSRDYTGILHTPDCYNYAPEQLANQGCTISADRQDSYGQKFNEAGGGTYAVEWTSDSIKVWIFGKNKEPEDLKKGELFYEQIFV
jgi:hypothetical protein